VKFTLRYLTTLGVATALAVFVFYTATPATAPTDYARYGIAFLTFVITSGIGIAWAAWRLVFGEDDK
jgi:hypothetical protein